MSVEWLLLTSATSIKPTEWICVVISWTASLRLCHGLVLLAVVYFRIYLQKHTVIFLLHSQSCKISFQNHDFILVIFPLSLSVRRNPVHPPARYFPYISKKLLRDLDLFAWLVQSEFRKFNLWKRNSRVLKRQCLPCSCPYTIIYVKHLFIFSKIILE